MPMLSKMRGGAFVGGTRGIKPAAPDPLISSGAMRSATEYRLSGGS
jgi:hypothetical protein